MSITFGMLGENYSIVGSDSRCTDLRTDKYRDDAQKTFMFNYGWVANCGGVTFATKLFKTYMNMNAPKTRKEIYCRWLLSIKNTHEMAQKISQEIFDIVDSATGSSQAFYSLNYFKNGKAHISVEGVDFAYKMRKIKSINSLVMSSPKNRKRTRKAIRNCSERIKTTTGLYESIYQIAYCIDKISRYEKWISNTLDLGISLQISDNEILLMSIHANAKELKHIYEKTKDYSNLMIVRKVIHC